MNWVEFVAESNRIEGILRPPTDDELSATVNFVQGPPPTIDLLVELAGVYTEGKGLLRNQRGMNVRVGLHVAPKGGPRIYSDLVALLAQVEELGPYEFHVAYETLHPFLDGNGRTGRALWAWQMHFTQPRLLRLGFLHAFYYQALAASRTGDNQ